MSKSTFIICLVAIAVMPLIYIVMNSFEPEEVYSFRGMPVQTIEPQHGSVIVPNESENANNMPMRANLKASYVEKIAGLKLPFPEPLDLTIQSVSDAQSACTEDGSIADQAGFEYASACAETGFAKANIERKTALEIDPREKFIIFGATANNQVRLYHNNMIANYVSKDMTQGDRKREACIVRIVMDHLIGKAASVESSCLSGEQG